MADTSAPTAGEDGRRRWPLLLIGASAGTATWSGWVGLGELTGFGVVHPLPGIWDDLTLNTALLMRASLTRFAVERVEPVVRAEQRPPVVLLTSPSDAENLLHRLAEVVVLDLHRRDPAQLLERGDVALEERFL